MLGEQGREAVQYCGIYMNSQISEGIARISGPRSTKGTIFSPKVPKRQTTAINALLAALSQACNIKECVLAVMDDGRFPAINFAISRDLIEAGKVRRSHLCGCLRENPLVLID